LLDDAVIKVLPLPLRSAAKEVFDIVRTKVVRLVGQASKQRYPLGFAAHPEVGEHECLVCIDVIAIDLMQGVQLRRSETRCRFVGRAEEEIGLEIASIWVRDNRVDYTICAVALTDHFCANDGEEGGWDVVSGCVR